MVMYVSLLLFFSFIFKTIFIALRSKVPEGLRPNLKASASILVRIFETKASESAHYRFRYIISRKSNECAR